MLEYFVHEYPLAFQHEGTMLGNSWLGLYAWGGGSILNVSVGCSELWDHRGGMQWTEKHNFHDIRQALQARDKAAVTAIFASDTAAQPGVPDRPTLVPVGRIQFRLDEDCCLKRNSLSRMDGALEIIYQRRGREYTAVLRLDMTDKGRFALKCAHVAEVRVISTSEFMGEEWGKKYSYVEPLELEREKLHGFLQPLPCDPAFALAVTEDGDLYTGLFKRDTDLDQLVIDMQGDMTATCSCRRKEAPGLQSLDWDKLAASNKAWWAEFWSTIPEVSTGNPNLDYIYYDGFFKFASMTGPDGYPAGLQGPWIEDYAFPPWSGDYHFNINVEMCYWAAFRGNKLEHLKPLFDMIWSWRDSLQNNAKNFLGIEDGYMLPHAVDDRCTCMGMFWTGIIDHACTAWIAQMMFDYVDYGGDLDYLRETVFPFMKGAMRVFRAMLEMRDGKYVLPVTVSPEYKDAEMDAWGENSSFHLAALHRLARNLVKAAGMLGENPDPAWLEIMEKLPLASVYTGKDGIREIGVWDGTVLEESHRHHSHLAGLWPFDVIDAEDPAWRTVMRATLTRWKALGMGNWTGWCLPWAAILQSRMGNPDAAEITLEIWKKAFNNPGGGSLHDAAFPGMFFWDKRPYIMQMDGAMGAITAVQELLLHSRNGVEHLFAGISMLHKEASFSNMAAPGGFLISAKRSENDCFADVKARRAGTLQLRFHGCGASKAVVSMNGKETTVELKENLTLEMPAGAEAHIRFINS